MICVQVQYSIKALEWWNEHVKGDEDWSLKEHYSNLCLGRMGVIDV